MIIEYPICVSQNVGRIGMVPDVVIAKVGRYLLFLNTATLWILTTAKTGNRKFENVSEAFVQ